MSDNSATNDLHALVKRASEWNEVDRILKELAKTEGAFFVPPSKPAEPKPQSFMSKAKEFGEKLTADAAAQTAVEGAGGVTVVVGGTGWGYEPHDEPAQFTKSPFVKGKLTGVVIAKETDETIRRKACLESVRGVINELKGVFNIHLVDSDGCVKRNNVDLMERIRSGLQNLLSIADADNIRAAIDEVDEDGDEVTIEDRVDDLVEELEGTDSWLSRVSSDHDKLDVRVLTLESDKTSNDKILACIREELDTLEEKFEETHRDLIDDRIAFSKKIADASERIEAVVAADVAVDGRLTALEGKLEAFDIRLGFDDKFDNKLFFMLLEQDKKLNALDRKLEQVIKQHADLACDLVSPMERKLAIAVEDIDRTHDQLVRSLHKATVENDITVDHGERIDAIEAKVDMIVEEITHHGMFGHLKENEGKGNSIFDFGDTIHHLIKEVSELKFPSGKPKTLFAP
jgi:hypothetical protein